MNRVTTHKDIPIAVNGSGQFYVMVSVFDPPGSVKRKNTPEAYHDLKADTLAELREKIDKVAKRTFERVPVWVRAGYSYFERDNDDRPPYVRGVLTSHNPDKSRYRSLRVTPDGGNNQEYGEAYADSEPNRQAFATIARLTKEKRALETEIAKLESGLERWGDNDEGDE